jgi:hypothetical protein
VTQRVAFDVTLTVKSPFLFRALHGALLGVDAAQLRDEAGSPVIPADQLRGLLREAMVDLAGATQGSVVSDPMIDRLFGRESRKVEETGEHDRPERALLVFSDLRAARTHNASDGTRGRFLPSGEVTRIEIDDQTGAARTGHIFVTELAAPMGASVPFTGEIVALLEDDEVEPVTNALGKALKLIAAIGAFKSVGFGEVVPEQTSIRAAPARPLALRKGEQLRDERFNYHITFDRPFLVDARRVANNAFLGSAIIPGAVIKGALARRLELAGEEPESGRFAKALAALVVSHAFPETPDGRLSGLPLPLSMVGVKQGNAIKLGDALETPRGKGAMIDGEAARFVANWKRYAKPDWFAAAREAIGHPPYREPAKLGRTHTSIGPAGTALDQELFTTVARSNLLPDDPAKLRKWRVTLDFGNVENVEARAVLRALFEEGLDAVGKTGASIGVRPIENIKMPEPKPIDGTKDRFAVVLRTPAILTAASPGTPASDAYAAYWKSVLPHASLVDFFATQRLAGGYQSVRRRAYGNDAYRPFVLTEPGSVFLLEGPIIESLNKLIRFGLPVPLLGGRPVNWKTCPFVPENGFGAVDIEYLSDPRTNSLRKAVAHE